ncbi:hypothetical protein D3C71_813360 [compost metagenome]
MGVGGGLVNTARTAGRQHGGLGFEVNHFTGFDADSRGADHCAILVFHQIQRIPLGEDSSVVFQILLVQGVQQRVTGTVSRRSGACRLCATEVQ